MSGGKKVNEKEAHLILTKVWPEEIDPVGYGEARGYIKAIEKAKGLVETLEKIYEECAEQQELEGGHGHCHCECVIALEALAQWEKEK